MSDEILEYHLCSECTYRINVPTDPNYRTWELACTEKRREVNRHGGLTRCPVFEPKD